MGMRVHMATFTCTDPRALAAFWADTLGMTVAADTGEAVFLAPAGEGALMLSFERGSAASANSVGSTLRLDISGEPLVDQVPRVLGLGATLISEHEVPGVTWKVLADPEGNEFALVEHAPDVAP